MTDTAREKVAELEAEVEHARAIAACSIGQPDRAENVAYREEMEAKLRSARAEAEKSTVRDKVASFLFGPLPAARAINPNDPDIVIRTGIADAAIAAHLDALKADGYALVKLPESIGDDGVNRAWQWVSRWWDLPPNEPRVVSMHSAPHLLSVDDARCLAAQLLAAANAAEAQR